MNISLIYLSLIQGDFFPKGENTNEKAKKIEMKCCGIMQYVNYVQRKFFLWINIVFLNIFLIVKSHHL